MFCFVKPATIIFLFFVPSQRLVRSFFEINIFQVGPSHDNFSDRLRHMKHDVNTVITNLLKSDNPQDTVSVHSAQCTNDRTIC